MCGRTMCMLAPGDIQRACAYRNNGNGTGNDGFWKVPRWKTSNGNQSYNRSYNIAPGCYTPVMLSGKHFSNDQDFQNENRVIQPMYWGLHPSWHNGKTSFNLNNNNCRTETFLQKNMFKGAAKKGQRCIILCEGYYEWKKEESSKSAYFIYNEQDAHVKIHDEKWHSDQLEEFWDEQNGWSGPRLMYMAGIFDCCTKDNEPFYSYSVLTMDSSQNMSWLHHRMPVFLESEEAVSEWLDFESLPTEKATYLFTAPKKLKFHAVSNTVNNSKNNVPECIIPQVLVKPKLKAESKLMMSWLKKGTDAECKNEKRSAEDSCDEPVKKVKIEK